MNSPTDVYVQPYTSSSVGWIPRSEIAKSEDGCAFLLLLGTAKRERDCSFSHIHAITGCYCFCQTVVWEAPFLTDLGRSWALKRKLCPSHRHADSFPGTSYHQSTLHQLIPGHLGVVRTHPSACFCPVHLATSVRREGSYYGLNNLHFCTPHSQIYMLKFQPPVSQNCNQIWIVGL